MDVKMQGPFNVTGKEIQDACLKLEEVAKLFSNITYPTARGLAATITASLQFIVYEWTEQGFKVLTTPHRTAELNKHYKAMVDAADEAVGFIARINNGTYEDPKPNAGSMTEAEVNDLWEKEQKGK
jgi:hypothetical protein